MNYQAAIIEFVIRQWRSLPVLGDYKPPPGILIAECEEINSQKANIDTAPLHAWLAQGTANRSLSIAEYEQFIAELEQSLQQPLPVPVRLRNPYFPLGMVKFARWQGTSEIVIEMVWGGRVGLGVVVSLNNAGGVETGRTIWVA